MIEFEIFGIPFLKKGKEIYIKKKNRGKFTASAKRAGESVLEHATSVLNNPKATKLQKKRALFAKNAAKWKHEEGAKIHKPDGHPSILDNGWINNKLIRKHAHGDKVELTEEEKEILRLLDIRMKLEYLNKNKDKIIKLLKGVDHKRGTLNVLLNEGYLTNLLNLGYSINADSLVNTNNPEDNPGETAYSELGNFGLDSINDEEAKLIGLTSKDLVQRTAFDNGRKLQTVEKITPTKAATLINYKLNLAKKWLYDKYGRVTVSKFLRAHPGSEDEFLYAGYKMPYKLKDRINKQPTIDALYKQYIEGGLNRAFKLVRNYSETVDKILGK